MISEILQTRLLEAERLASIIRAPAHWTEFPDGHDYALVDLVEDSPEFAAIKRELRSSRFRAKIIKISRIQNEFLYRRFAITKEKIEKQNPNMVNEWRLWHGSSEEIVLKITKYGYDKGFCSDDGALGCGIYFAKKPSYAGRIEFATPNEFEHQNILCTRVMIGQYVTGDELLVEPPELDSKDGYYNAVCDDDEEPTKFAVFDRSQCYPEYRVTITKK